MFKAWKHVLPPEAKLIHGDGEVPGLLVAVIKVAVVHRDEVHVAENEAVVRGLLQGLPVADVQQLGPVERVLAQLWKRTQEERGLAHVSTRRRMSSSVIRNADHVV